MEIANNVPKGHCPLHAKLLLKLQEFVYGELEACVGVQAYMRLVVPNVDGHGYKALNK